MGQPPLGQTVDWVRRGTALSSLFRRELSTKYRQRMPVLVLEGALATGVAVMLVRGAAPAHAGVIAVFLTAAGLTPRLESLLDENRAAVYERNDGRANPRTAVSLFSLFVGVFVAGAVTVAYMPEPHLAQLLPLVRDVGELGGQTIVTRSFGSFFAIFGNNVGVLATAMVIALLYRSIGTLLVLCWNAGVWAIVLGALIRQTTAMMAISRGTFVALAFFAVVPHLLLEAAAYVTGSLAGIFLSRAAFLYGFRSERFRQVAVSSLRMLVAAHVLLVVAALAEATIPNLVLPRLTR